MPNANSAADKSKTGTPTGSSGADEGSSAGGCSAWSNGGGGDTDRTDGEAVGLNCVVSGWTCGWCGGGDGDGNSVENGGSGDGGAWGLGGGTAGLEDGLGGLGGCVGIGARGSRRRGGGCNGSGFGKGVRVGTGGQEGLASAPAL